MKDANVLVTGAGSVVGEGIIKCLRLASSRADGPVKYRIIATDASPLAAGIYRSDKGVLVPRADSPDYIEYLIRVARKEGATAVFVGSDEELGPVTESRQQIEEETGAAVIVNPPEVLSAARDKWETFVALRRLGLPHAKSALPDGMDSFVRENAFPLVVKPREGHGSVGFHIVRDREGAREAISTIERMGWRPLLQEFLGDDDQEYTTGVVMDARKGDVVSSIAMRRTLRGGQTYKAFVDDFKDVRRSAEEIAVKLGCRGPLNVQARMVGDQLKVFELNPRISASCPMRAVAGVNEPDILYRNAVLGEAVRISSYERLACFRYWNEVYVPFRAFEGMAKDGETSSLGSLVPDYF
ncbi:MAG TPA: ATP-grasp domain-containing protein [Nitrososphaerales archaeon]|nr:ATP-grasp domain-containing protein [Nitrososphaerales archaeon]